MSTPTPGPATLPAPAWALGGLALLAVLSRLLLLAQTPFEVDSVLLLRAVEDFDPTAMRPHPPGYPGVVGLARMLPLEPALALRVVAALSAGPLVLFTALVGRRMGADPLVAAALVLVNPLAWLYGITENAYAPGAAAAAWLAWECLRARDVPGAAPALRVGLALGVVGALRPSDLVFLAPMAAWGAGRRLGVAALGALPVTAAWLGACAWASGGLGAYLGAVQHQFTWIREGQVPHWRLHQVHHLGVYLLQAGAGAWLLLPWVRRPPQHAGLWALWLGVPLAFHLLVYVAKPGYLLVYTPALAIALAQAPVPVLGRRVAIATSLGFFLLADPVDVEIDPTPRRAFAQKSWPERLVSEGSFLSMTSLRRTWDQDRANRAYTALLAPQVEPGRTLVLWVDRWDPAIAGVSLPGARVVDSRTPTVGVDRRGVRLLLLAWEAPEGFTPLRDAQGYGAWVRELRVEDLPLTVHSLTLRPAW